jgi:DMSO reductase anchor subunit
MRPNLAALGVFTALAGLAAVFCSVMIYHDTRRAFWTGLNTGGKFFGTTALLGTAAAWVFTSRADLAWLVLVICLAKLVCEGGVLSRPSLTRTAEVIWGPLRPLHSLRFALGIIGGLILPLAYLAGSTSLIIPVASLILCCAGELAERYLFFAAAAPNKMPGAPR